MQSDHQDHDAIQFFRTLLQIPSPSGEEATIASFLAQFLKAHNFQIIPSACNNVVGVRGSGSPVILLASHMDTVVTNNPFREEGNKVYATGAVDCKASLASLFYTAASIPWPEGFGTIIIAGIVHEEDATFGIEEIFQMGFLPECAIFGEPTRNDRICVGYRGRVVTRLHVTVEPGHASITWDYDNPLEIIQTIYSELMTHVLKFNTVVKHGTIESGTDIHFGEISLAITQLHEGPKRIRSPHREMRSLIFASRWECRWSKFKDGSEMQFKNTPKS